jgi:hypothetical protein
VIHQIVFQIRAHAASLQNHSARIHEATYRRNKIKQAMGQSLALLKDLEKAADGKEGDPDKEVNCSQ